VTLPVWVIAFALAGVAALLVVAVVVGHEVGAHRTADAMTERPFPESSSASAAGRDWCRPGARVVHEQHWLGTVVRVSRVMGLESVSVRFDRRVGMDIVAAMTLDPVTPADERVLRGIVEERPRLQQLVRDVRREPAPGVYRDVCEPGDPCIRHRAAAEVLPGTDHRGLPCCGCLHCPNRI
jgi:hypothetical protein